MDIEVMTALEEARPVLEFDVDWRDVVERAERGHRPVLRRKRRRLSFAALGAATAVVLLATPALGVRGRLLSFFDLARGPSPAQAWHLAGAPVQPTGALRAAAQLTHVEAGTLRRIAVGGLGYRRLVLIGGIGPDRRPWLAQVGPGWVSNFFPLFGRLGEIDRPVWHTRTAHGWDGWQFPMYGRSAETRPVFGYVAFGGTELHAVSWATVVGFARGDVARLELTTAGGAHRRLTLTASGGYSYASTVAAGLPRELTAVDAAGRVLGRERFALQPLAP